MPEANTNLLSIRLSIHCLSLSSMSSCSVCSSTSLAPVLTNRQSYTPSLLFGARPEGLQHGVHTGVLLHRWGALTGAATVAKNIRHHLVIAGVRLSPKTIFNRPWGWKKERKHEYCKCFCELISSTKEANYSLFIYLFFNQDIETKLHLPKPNSNLLHDSKFNIHGTLNFLEQRGDCYFYTSFVWLVFRVSCWTSTASSTVDIKCLMTVTTFSNCQKSSIETQTPWNSGEVTKCAEADAMVLPLSCCSVSVTEHHELTRTHP